MSFLTHCLKTQTYVLPLCTRVWYWALHHKQPSALPQGALLHSAQPMPSPLPAGLCQDNIRFTLHTSHWTKSCHIETNYHIQMVYKWHLLSQFSVAHNVYLSHCREVDKKVKETLGWQHSNWCLAYTCPACMYKLENEPKIIFNLLWAMDGNNSLKWRIWHVPKGEGVEPGPSIEWIDTRSIGEDISISEVHSWVGSWNGGSAAASHWRGTFSFIYVKFFWLNTWYRSWGTIPVQSNGRTWLRKLQTGCGESLMKLGYLRYPVTMGLP